MTVENKNYVKNTSQLSKRLQLKKDNLTMMLTKINMNPQKL